MSLKKKSGRVTITKRTTSSQDIDEYISRTPEPARSVLVQMRTAIRSALPPETEEVISYRMPAFKLKKVLVWYAAFKEHCSLFPTGAALDRYKNELAGFNISKGTVQFPLDRPLPTGLIKKLVKARLEQSGYQPAGKKSS